MNFHIMKAVICSAVLLVSAMHSDDDRALSVPKGWFFRSHASEDYRFGTDHNTKHGGRGSGFVQYAVHPMVVHPRRAPSYLLQAFKANQYAGHRLRMSAYAKGERLSSGAFLWVHLEGESQQLPYHLERDLQQLRHRDVALSPLLSNETTDWSKLVCVVDVPSSTTVVAIGAQLTGRGTIWLDDLHIEVVGSDVPLSGIVGYGSPSLDVLEIHDIADAPKNLDFEQ